MSVRLSEFESEFQKMKEREREREREAPKREREKKKKKKRWRNRVQSNSVFFLKNSKKSIILSSCLLKNKDFVLSNRFHFLIKRVALIALLPFPTTKDTGSCCFSFSLCIFILSFVFLSRFVYLDV